MNGFKRKKSVRDSIFNDRIAMESGIDGDSLFRIMKKNYSMSFNRTKTFIYLVTMMSTLILVSCSEKLLENPTGNMMLRINVEGVNATEEVMSNNISQAAKALSAESMRISPATLDNSESGFQVDFATDQNLMESNSLQGGKDALLPTKNRAATPMQNGFTYRVLLYNKNTGALWQTVQGRAGTPISMDAGRGETYEWYAYSYNNAEELTVPANSSNPMIETAINKDFLYAHGEITIPTDTQTEFGLAITFEHKVAQIHIKVDATVLARYAKINNLRASFDKNNYLKKGVFNIKNNQMTAVEAVPTETIFSGPSTTNIWETSYYTVDPAAVSNYKIVINDLPVKFNGVSESISERNLATYFGASNLPTFTSNFTSPGFGQRLSSILNLNYQVAPLRILHISNATSYGYALQQGPAWDFLNSKENFGDLPESVVKMGSWAVGQGSWSGGHQSDNKNENWLHYANTNNFDNQLASRLSPANTVNRPDIVIIGYNMTTIRPAVAAALNNYLNNRGVVIMMLQGATNASSQSFFNNLFGVSNIGTISSGSGGAMYPLVGNNPDDDILNGPFGDVRGRHWGEDAGTTLGLTNLPLSQITVYSNGNAINRSSLANRVTMFKHNTKNFFYIGDGGFVSYNGGTSSTICPFNYDRVAKRPLPKPYGNAGNGYVANSQSAYNGIIIGNIMAWAVGKAEFEGVRQWKYAGPPTQ